MKLILTFLEKTIFKMKINLRDKLMKLDLTRKLFKILKEFIAISTIQNNYII